MHSSQASLTCPSQDKEKEFSTQPIDDKKSFDPKTAHHNAAPGPAIPKDFSAQEEGTKEERRAKAAAMNQPSDQ